LRLPIRHQSYRVVLNNNSIGFSGMEVLVVPVAAVLEEDVEVRDKSLV
jgi:hypothetical protein